MDKTNKEGKNCQKKIDTKNSADQQLHFALAPNYFANQFKKGTLGEKDPKFQSFQKEILETKANENEGEKANKNSLNSFLRHEFSSDPLISLNLEMNNSNSIQENQPSDTSKISSIKNNI